MGIRRRESLLSMVFLCVTPYKIIYIHEGEGEGGGGHTKILFKF